MQRMITNMPLARAEAALRSAFWAGRVLPAADDRDRVLQALVARPDGCCLWPGRVRKGRGRTSLTLAGKRVELDAHRAVFVLVIGPIPVDHVVTQMCGNHRCARPEHLELISPRQLWARGVAAGRVRPLRGWQDGHGRRRAA